MSSRTYLRHFARATGTSPIKWLINQRLQASLPLLEKTDKTVERIARDVGFDTAVTYRHHFGRMMRTSPSSYRHAFRPDPDMRASDGAPCESGMISGGSPMANDPG